MTFTRILYRGSLSSCNYSCGYCPFAKTTNTHEELNRDRQQLEKFVDWVDSNPRPIGVFITPWGEALIHRYYRKAMVELSQMAHVQRVVIQTNLSGHVDDLVAGNCEHIAIWATYHPGETDGTDFLERCERLQKLKIRFSVGVVGFRKHFLAISALREQLPDNIYLWINAPKSSGIQYSSDDLRFLTSIDPYFHWNIQYWESRDKPCQTGLNSFAVNGLGDVRRCHFVDHIFGNIYRDDIWSRLAQKQCPNKTCGCHIGYVNRDDFHLDRLYGDNILERIPERWPETKNKAKGMIC